MRENCSTSGSETGSQSSAVIWRQRWMQKSLNRRSRYFTGEFGVGKLGLHKAFRVRHTDDGAQIIPITNIAHVKLDDLVGYELAKQKLVDNTEAFVRQDVGYLIE